MWLLVFYSRGRKLPSAGDHTQARRSFADEPVLSADLRVGGLLPTGKQTSRVETGGPGRAARRSQMCGQACRLPQRCACQGRSAATRKTSAASQISVWQVFCANGLADKGNLKHNAKLLYIKFCKSQAEALLLQSGEDVWLNDNHGWNRCHVAFLLRDEPLALLIKPSDLLWGF